MSILDTAVSALDTRKADMVPEGYGAYGDYERGKTGFEFFNPREIWSIIVRWRWLVIALTGLGLLLGLTATLLTTPIYEASATIEINPEPTRVIDVGDVGATTQKDAGYFMTQLELLKSKTLAERVSRELGLPSNPKVVDPALSPDIRSKIATAWLQDSLSAGPRGVSRLFDIRFQSEDPVLASRIANKFADSFIQAGLDRRYDASTFARNFLQERLEQTRQKLEESERQLVVYARANQLVNVTTENSADGKQQQQSLAAITLGNLNKSLADSQSARIAAEQRYRQSQATGSNKAFQDSSQGLQAELAQLRAQYEEAMKIYKPDYPDVVRLRGRMDSLQRTLSAQRGTVSNTLESDYRAALGAEQALRSSVEALKGDVLDQRQQNIQYNILQREVDTNRTVYDALLQRYKEIGVAGGVGENLISLIDRADVPVSPVKPSLPTNLAMGLMTGLFLGVLLAFGLNFINDTIVNPGDMATKLGIKPLGIIPEIEGNIRPIDALLDPKSPLAEAYLALTNSLRFASANGFPKVLLVTSALPGEGKSTTSLAIARNMAMMGRRVLLIDGDMRKPTFRTGKVRGFGLSNLLTGDKSIDEVIAPASQNLWLVQAGDIPPNPAELLSGEGAARIIHDLVSRFDNVVIDGPPVLGFADAPILGSIAHGTLAVFEAGRTRGPVAQSTLAKMRNSSTVIVGGLITKASAKHDSYAYSYSYAYNYDYSASKEKDGEGSADRRTLDISTLK